MHDLRDAPTEEWDPRSDWSLALRDTMPRTETSPPELIGGRYRVLGVLGRGATATVYEVEDIQTGALRALKLLEVTDPISRARLHREVAAMVRLEHPAAVRVFSVDTLGDRDYIVMERVDGLDLLTWMRENVEPMDLLRTVRLFRGVAECLHEAHELGLVHRDVKHSNLVLERRPGSDECLRLLDFGLAKRMDGQASLTSMDRVVGTPAYMCPERLFTNARATPAWDIYSMGVVLHELLTRRPLFRADSWPQVMDIIQHRMPPPVSASRPEAPPSLDVLVDEMLSKEPVNRPSGADVVARRLARVEDMLSR